MANKIALITGASTGIGAAVAISLAEMGIDVALCDVNSQDGLPLAESIGGQFFYCDVTDLNSVQEAIDQCVANLGVPSYIHLNAGIMTVPAGTPYVAIEDVSEQQYRKILGVNLDGVFHCMKVALPLMRRNGGTVTITASVAGLSVVPADPLYTATKYALIGFGRAAAAANEGSNVRINVICPGVVDTAIVPDDYRTMESNMMSPSVIAAEIVDLLFNGANGEVRVKLAADRPAFAVEKPDLST